MHRPSWKFFTAKRCCLSNVIDLIKGALNHEAENRYLLLLAQNENALDVINNYILNEFDSKDGSNTSKVSKTFGLIKYLFSDS